MRDFPAEPTTPEAHPPDEGVSPDDREALHETGPDLVTRLAGVSDESSMLERSLGPSCFLSLVIVFLLLVAFRRLLQLPIPMLVLVVLVVWAVVLTILVRGRPIHISDD